MKLIYIPHINRELILFLLVTILIVPAFLCSKLKNKQPDILTFEQLVKANYETPYILDLQKGKKRLVFYGSDHSNNPSDPMFNDIEKYFLDLKPQIAFNEGGDPPSFDDRNRAIQIAGEAGFLRYLGERYNIPVKNIEPPPKGEFDFLLKKYSKNDVLLMYFCRQIPQFKRKTDQVNFETYMPNFLKSLKVKGFLISDKEATLKYLIARYEDFFGEQFDWEKFDPKNIYPIYYTNILNEIVRESSQFRDRYAVKMISDTLKKCARVFVVMGSGHAVKQEPILRSLFK